MYLRLESVAIQNQKNNKLAVHNNLHIKKDFEVYESSVQLQSPPNI